MPDLSAFSNGARLAFKTLQDHPELNTPEAIAEGPYGVDQIDAEDVERGLAELRAAVLAVETFGDWNLVEQSPIEIQ